MDDSERTWDVADARRPRRANRGSLLPALLEKGLDSEEEHLLRDLSDATTDSTFAAGSDEETVDEVDSDFSDEELEGVLEGEAPETEAMVRRGERDERRLKRERAGRRAEAAAEAAAAATRLRPPPTIPLAERMAAARRRARDARAAHSGDAESTAAAAAAAAAAAGNAEKARERHRRERMRRQGLEGGDIVNRVRYISSRAVLEKYGVPVIVSFSHCLPPVLRQQK